MTNQEVVAGQNTQNLAFTFETNNPVRNLVIVAATAVAAVAVTTLVKAITKKL